MRKAVFPGSFDPFHNGHKDIIDRSIDIFDEIIIGIGTNLEKKYLYSQEERKNMIESIFLGYEKIKVKIYKGLTVDFCKSVEAKYIIRGIRNSFDFDFEKSIIYANRKLDLDIETILILTSVENSFISSSIVRDIIKNNGNIEKFVPWENL